MFELNPYFQLFHIKKKKNPRPSLCACACPSFWVTQLHMFFLSCILGMTWQEKRQWRSQSTFSFVFYAQVRSSCPWEFCTWHGALGRGLELCITQKKLWIWRANQLQGPLMCLRGWTLSVVRPSTSRSGRGQQSLEGRIWHTLRWDVSCLTPCGFPLQFYLTLLWRTGCLSSSSFCESYTWKVITYII